MYQSVTRNKRGEIDKKKYSISSYRPTDEECLITEQVKEDMSTGRDILTKPWAFFNDRSIISEIDYNQKRFNNYIPPKSDDPSDSWRAQTMRPLTRNKVISIAAHMTAKMLYPNVFAQNKDDNEDRLAQEVMRDVIEYAIENSEYRTKFLGAVIGALTDPLATLEVGFAKVMRKVKEMQSDGKYTTQEIIDEVLSGFYQNYVQANELYLVNAWESNIQKQRAVAVRKKIDWAEARAKYGSHKNFSFIVKGASTRYIFDELTKTFYEVQDEDLDGCFVEEVRYMNRYEDLEVVFINGVLVTEPNRPMTRKDKLYGLATTGYEPINNGNFAYYKSLVNKLGSDQDTIDTMYNMVMDGSFLQLMPSMAIFGSEEFDSNIMSPGMATNFTDKDSRIERISPQTDIRAGMEAINLLEKSMAESSRDSFQQGILQPGERTAQEIQALQTNARISLGVFGQMLSNFVRQIGNLMVGDIVQYMATGEIDQIVGEEVRLRYKTILLKDKIVKGQKKTKKIVFTDKYAGKDELGADELFKASMDLYNKEQDMGGDSAIWEINAPAFRDMKYHVYVAPDFLAEKSQELEKALNLEAYDRAIQNPVISQDIESMKAITRDFMLEIYKPGESDKYMPKETPPPQMPSGNPGDAVAAMQENQFTQKGVNTNLTQQITGATSMKKLQNM